MDANRRIGAAAGRQERTGWLGRRDSNLCIPESKFAMTLSLGRVDSNLCISESEFAKTLSLGGGIRTSAYRNHLNGGFGPDPVGLAVQVEEPT